MSDYKKPVEDLADDLREYVDLRVDDLKLKIVKGLSIAASRLIVSLVLVMLMSFALITLAFVLALLVGGATGNYAFGAFLSLIFVLIVLAVVFFFRKKMFTGGFVRMFMQIFFPDDDQQ